MAIQDDGGMVAILGLDQLDLKEAKELLSHIQDHNARGMLPPGMPTPIRKMMIEKMVEGVEARIAILSDLERVTVGFLTESECLKLAEGKAYGREVAKLQAQLTTAKKRAQLSDEEFWHTIYGRLGIAYDRVNLDIRIAAKDHRIAMDKQDAEKMGLEIISTDD